MLAKRRGFYRNGAEIIRTPLLLPSFSSKGFPHVQNILEATQEVIEGEILISAYDLHHRKLKGPFDFAQSVFLDSGGYEASGDVEFSDTRAMTHKPEAWSLTDYEAIIANWTAPCPTVIISYDHPNDRIAVLEQIKRAEETIPRGDNLFREILFKPNEKDDDLTDVDAIVANIHRLVAFDAIGVTEKEIGPTLQSRMCSIARLRRALNAAGLGSTPIHVFGSLDTMSTPLYFVAGADIFDGLTWLRYAYHEGQTIYQQNYAIFRFGIQIKSRLVEASCSFANYYYMKEMQREMRNFLQTGSFDSFSYHKELIEGAYQAVVEETET